jgi:hypothetical protein
LQKQVSNKPNKDKRKAAGPEPNHLSQFDGKGTAVFQKKQKIMKKNRISDILGVISVLCVFAGCVEGPDGGLTFWTIICLAAAFCFGWLSKKTEEAK